MKKLCILTMFVCITIMSLAQTGAVVKANCKQSNIEIVLNQQVEMLTTRIDSMAIAHQVAIGEVKEEQKNLVSNYYNQLDSDFDRFLIYMTILWSVLGVLFGIVMPLILNNKAEQQTKDEIRALKDVVKEQIQIHERVQASRLRELYKDVDQQIKKQNKTFGTRFAEHKAYIDKVSNEIEHYECQAKINQLLTEVQNIYNEDAQKATLICSEILQLDKNNENALLWRGIANSTMGKPQEALSDLRAALVINPTLARAYNNIGNVYLKEGQYDMALQNYKNALEINPRYDVVYRNIGLVYMKQGADLSLAEENLNKALDINPNYIVAYNTRSKLYREMSKRATTEEMRNKYNQLSLADARNAQKLQANDNQK